MSEAKKALLGFVEALADEQAYRDLEANVEDAGGQSGNAMTQTKLMTVPRLMLGKSELAVALGVSANTIDEMLRLGYLPKPRHWRRRRLWIVSEVEVAIARWPEEPGADLKQASDNWI